jgi:Flavin-binding monooxygenase-like
MSSIPTEDRYALIGAGPAGLAGARCLDKAGLPFDGFEAHGDVGGLWDITNPRSTVYETAHLISSKRMTEFSEFPMAEHVADYPSHKELRQYFSDFADRFDLRRHYRFGTLVRRVEPLSEGPDSRWQVTFDTGSGPQTAVYKGVVIANGTLAEPQMPRFAGRFDGELMHTSSYKHPGQLAGKRVLVVGAGNSGCDIAVDAVHHAEYVDISVRRGYYFVPKYVFGRPADTVGGRITLPPWLKQRVDATILRWFTGDPVRFGFPKPGYRMYESHPVVNSLILHHLGHGDLHVRPDVERFDGKVVHFKDGSQREYDLVLAATGYKLHYPFIAAAALNWHGMAPRLYLNIFPPHYRRLAVLGMVEASGLGWQGRYEQADAMAAYFVAQDRGLPVAQAFEARVRGPLPDLSGGYRYLKLERMAYYVHKETYRSAVRAVAKELAG